MKQKKTLRNYWAPQYWPTWIGLGCLRLICLLPHPRALAVGRVFGRLAHRVAGERRAIVRRNIELSFPELSTAERNTLAYKHFLALGMSAIELGQGRWASDRTIQDLCDIEGLEYVEGPRASDPEDIRETNLNTFVPWEIDSGDSCHALLPLTLLVARVLADHPNAAMPPDDPTLLAHLLR